MATPEARLLSSLQIMSAQARLVFFGPKRYNSRSAQRLLVFASHPQSTIKQK